MGSTSCAQKAAVARRGKQGKANNSACCEQLHMAAKKERGRRDSVGYPMVCPGMYVVRLVCICGSCPLANAFMQVGLQGWCGFILRATKC